MRFSTLLTLLLFLLPAAAAAQPPAGRKGKVPTPTPSPTPTSDPPKPSVVVSFERQSIREDDTVQVHVWLANGWDFELTGLALTVRVPERLKWSSIPCSDWRAKSFEGGGGDRPLSLTPLKAHEVRSYTFCVKSDSEIKVGEFNTLFTLDYEWARGDDRRHSFVTSEKTLKANLFGSDSVAGVPLGLAGIIVPGLFFWLVVARFKVRWLPWGEGGLALGDKLLFSVVVSVPILIAISLVTTRSPFPDVNTGISVFKLFTYGAVGAVLGLGFGLHEVYRRRREARRRAAQVQLDDPPHVLLGKLLRLYPDDQLPRAVARLPDGTEYHGTLAQKGDVATALVGSFHVNLDDLPQPIVDELRRARRPVDIFDVVERWGIESRLVPHDYVRKLSDGAMEEEDAAYFVRESQRVRRVDVFPEGGANPPLRLP